MLFVFGADEPLGGPEVVRRAAGLMPHARVEVVPGAGTTPGSPMRPPSGTSSQASSAAPERSHDAIRTTIHARRWKTLGVLSLSLLIIGLDNTVLNVALPTLQTHFSASGSTLQWIVDAYLLAFAGVLLTMGTLGDRFGRKRALQSGLVLFGVASVLAAFAQNADQLIVLRAVMGIGGAMIMPATLSVIMDVFPREERGKAIGIWSAIAGVGIGLGPFVGGLLLEWFSWSSVFWLNVPIVAVALVAGFFLVPESRDPRPGAFDLPGAGLSIATLVTLVYGIIEATPARLDRPARPRLLRAPRRCSAPRSSPGSAGSPSPMLPLRVLPRPALHRRVASASGSSSSR